MDKKINYKKLKDLREDKDLTQKQMAAKLNIEQSAYNKMERGKNGIRAEQLVIIAEVLGKNVDELIKKDKMENHKVDSLQSENEFLKSMLKLYRSHIESELMGLAYQYENQFPYYEYTFEQYLKLENDWQGPQEAVERIKQDVEQWQKWKKDGDTSSGFCLPWEENEIEVFINKDDKWLNEFVRKKENYDLVFQIVGCPTYHTQEDDYEAFKNMLNENSFINVFFQYGLMENSPYYSHQWSKYLEEYKLTLFGDRSHSYNELAEGGGVKINEEKTLINRKDREELRKKMRLVLPFEM